MREMTLDEIKRTELDILKHVADFCDANGINYCLAYGTLIGAVRHKGFIPWDDDIDIWMSLEDYKKFIAEYKDEDFPLRCIENTTTFLQPFAKIVSVPTEITELASKNYTGAGVYIDIFVLTNTSGNSCFRKIEQGILKAIAFQHSIATFELTKKDRPLWKRVIIHIAQLTAKIFNTQVCVKLMWAVTNFFASENSEYMFCLPDCKCLYKKAWFKNFAETDFEGMKFKIPAEYDKILTHIYGDYMTLPPVEQRVSNHSFAAYWKD